MKRLICLSVLVMLVGVMPVAWAGTEEEVEQAIQQWSQAFHEGNVEALGALYAEDAHFTPSLSPFRIEGRKAIQDLYAGLFRAFPKRRLILRQGSTRLYGDTAAIFTTYWQFTAVSAKGEVNIWYGRSNSTRMKIEGRWLVVDHHTSLLPGG